ncbi:MAG: hypothetical protein GIW99_01835 [Candidatus Eremiobacteraeota bacterium]|nr:hypothetical protein [Candidatus Eremiobacteraeota bacterium]MBC5826416.1 hypothetical protein [Candidatus Eremiobacteraeota bacterium]
MQTVIAKCMRSIDDIQKDLDRIKQALRLVNRVASLDVALGTENGSQGPPSAIEDTFRFDELLAEGS